MNEYAYIMSVKQRKLKSVKNENSEDEKKDTGEGQDMQNKEEIFEAISEKYGKGYMLRQLAEECSELAQAALKYIRVLRNETPMRIDEALEHLTDEIADVRLMIDAVSTSVLSWRDVDDMQAIKVQKLERWKTRMIDGDMDEDMW